MNPKTPIALLIGLALLLAQALPGMAASGDSCAPKAPACACCEGLDQCPCARESQAPDKPQMPLAPASSELLKTLPAQVTGTGIDWKNPAKPAAGAMLVMTEAATGLQPGYTGVSIPVALCSLVR
ncbi:MAG TPA: hypothetical protein VFY13_02065 [Luteolibacter sp.]|nr:hypothetical protein [Luteolibacter sp.]